MDEIKKMAKDKLRDNIQYEFKGNVSNTELMKQYQNKNYYVFVNVSSSEGIPVSIMEATSFGIPRLNVPWSEKKRKHARHPA